MKRIIIAVIVVGLIVAAAVILTRVAVSNARLNAALKVNKGVDSQMQEELTRIQTERDKLVKEKEKIDEDIVKYLSVNTKLQVENDNLKASLEDAGKSIKNLEADFSRAEQQYKLEIDRMAQKNKDAEKLAERLKKELLASGKNLKKEQEAYYYNLGVAYTRAKMYREAIDAYEKCLKAYPSSREAHYNLGLLYDKVLGSRSKALVHYKAFLGLNPAIQDRWEVENWIKELTKNSNIAQ